MQDKLKPLFTAIFLMCIRLLLSLKTILHVHVNLKIVSTLNAMPFSIVIDKGEYLQEQRLFTSN